MMMTRINGRIFIYRIFVFFLSRSKFPSNKGKFVVNFFFQNSYWGFHGFDGQDAIGFSGERMMRE
jgi:hypothetical protein